MHLTSGAPCTDKACIIGEICGKQHWSKKEHTKVVDKIHRSSLYRYEHEICAVPFKNKGIANYVLDGLNRRFAPTYDFTIRFTDGEAIILVKTNLDIKDNILKIMRGEKDNYGT